MKIREKTVLILGIVVISLFIVHFFASEIVVLGAFGRVESENAQKDTNRAVVALANDINTLDAVAQDWASRESLHRLMQDPKPAEILSSFDNETFERLQFNYIVFFNAAGQFVAGEGYDLQAKTPTTVPPSLAGFFLPYTHSARQMPAGGVLGVVQDSPDPILVAVRPVRGTGSSEPESGYILMARYLDAREVGRLENITQQPLSIKMYGEGLPEDFKSAVRFFSNKTAPFIQRQENDALIIDAPVHVAILEENMLGTYALIRDINGEPALVMRLLIPRDIYSEGKSTTIYFIALLLVSGFAFGGIILILLDETVLSRLSHLSDRVSSIGARQDFSDRISLPGADEVSQLATDVNTMLAELEQAQLYLQNRLTQSEENYHLFFNSISDPVLIFRFSDTKGYGPVIESNSAAADVLGYSRQELAEKTLPGLIILDNSLVLSSITADLLSKGEVQFEGGYQTRAGKVIPVEIHAHVFDHFGEKAVLTIARDITERKDIERLKMEAFLQIEKNMQQFAILNDHIRNPLQAIVGVADTLDCTGSEQIIRCAKTINDLVHKLDQGYIESEKIHEFLRKYYGVGRKT